MGAKTARWLVHNRDIVGVGIDSPSIDGYPSLMGHRYVLRLKDVL